MNVKHGKRLDNYGYDDRSARITFFENYFVNGNSREPKIDVGWIHFVNNVASPAFFFARARARARTCLR